ncbi:MAG: hypothetical protein IJQ14_06500 [Bacteroidales bacterium]|nr:hypothetical protein [Bacteroidales bacterium]
MKKTAIFVIALLLATVGFAQNPNNPNAKLNLVVGGFSGDYASDQRVNVLHELTKSHRANVIEQSAYESLPKDVRAKMRIDAVITGKCDIKTERKETTRTDKNGNKKVVPLYETKMTTSLTFTDPRDGKAILTPVFENSETDEDRNKSINSAIEVGHTRGKQLMLLMVQLYTLDEYLQETYPVTGKIVTVNESKKGKAESVTINLGSRDAIYRGQTFEVVFYKNGKQKNYGRMRVREINNDSLATCIVEKDGKNIMAAVESGEDVNITSYVQAVSLNGIVRVEQEAPRLNISGADDAKKRDVAFGSITGGAPSDFVTAVKENLKTNRRVNAYMLGTPACPDNAKLDGIICGYYTGMDKSSRLVKAEEHLLQLKDYTEYTTSIGWYLFIVDPNTGNIVYSGNEGTSASSDKSAEDATRQAIQNAATITSSTYSAFPLIGTILTVDDADPQKAKEVSIDLGSNYPVYKGLRFDVYSQDAAGGWEKIGRLEVSNVVDGTHSSCTVKKGGEVIQKVVENGTPVRITTYILKEFFEL